MKYWITNADPSIILCHKKYDNKYGNRLSISHYTPSEDKKVIENPVISENKKEIQHENENLIGMSIFTDYNAIKMANMDAVFKITSHVTSIREYQNNKSFTFCDLMDDNGGYTEYLQWRLPNSKGYGFERKWNLNIVDMNRLVLISGEKYDNLIRYISSRKSTGVDLIIGSASKKTQLGLLINFINERCKIGGYFICKIINLSHIKLHQIMFLTKIFEKVSFFKPLACYYNNERYIICTGFKGKMPLEENSKIVTKDFFDWIDKQNTITLTDIPIEQINSDKALLLWNIPGNIDPNLHI